MGSWRRGPSPLTDKRAQYLRLMQQGTSNAEACRHVGVNRKTGTRWKNGRKYTNRVGETWVYPPVADAEKLAGPPSGRYLSEFERIRIADLLRVDTTIREIGRQLGRSPATISREVNRNSDVDGVYHPYLAHKAAVERRARPNERKLDDDDELRRLRCRSAGETMEPTADQQRPAHRLPGPGRHVRLRGDDLPGDLPSREPATSLLPTPVADREALPSASSPQQAHQSVR